jgi:hypothetical protein
MVLAKCTAKSVESMNVLELLLTDAEHSRLKVFDLIICQMVTQKLLWEWAYLRDRQTQFELSKI